MSTVITGNRIVAQVEANCVVSDAPAMTDAHEAKLWPFHWHCSFRYGGK